ncbi:hypothetical protein HYPSUDRAFT_209089 [Hypholoma sublateritium FD-334 SS-4]|uniref:Uncharacterized protein n=1 Tax=Hypholoma sublateritium (strain FD-334 SS-4) TaxID=945553 RepID=A0A0D2NZW1_HYPSF|nr:hypothetical protein HYPSUDRAFT_209089 [Hypholoma sublateritium FD-334 SS-4]
MGDRTIVQEDSNVYNESLPNCSQDSTPKHARRGTDSPFTRRTRAISSSQPATKPKPPLAPTTQLLAAEPAGSADSSLSGSSLGKRKVSDASSSSPFHCPTKFARPSTAQPLLL